MKISITTLWFFGAVMLAVPIVWGISGIVGDVGFNLSSGVHATIMMVGFTMFGVGFVALLFSYFTTKHEGIHARV